MASTTFLNSVFASSEVRYFSSYLASKKPWYPTSLGLKWGSHHGYSIIYSCSWWDSLRKHLNTSSALIFYFNSSTAPNLSIFPMYSLLAVLVVLVELFLFPSCGSPLSLCYSACQCVGLVFVIFGRMFVFCFCSSYLEYLLDHLCLIWVLEFDHVFFRA